MSRLDRRFNFGSAIKNINEVLYNQMNDSYYSIALVVNTKSTRLVTTTNPPASGTINAGLDIGDFWVNSDTDTAWIMTSRANTENVTWKQIT